ncbi:hypothetical protein KYK30_20430 [Shinella yambaruensis]|uniref:Uncharacterized protein n=1 Tax=Shinella yambaruensis TaxID=415996 RepID=A0ABQ5ZHM8_9HYPH|nr:hypothetical protein [Shinella yambaruensis]MCJ8027039.1 hypothetical protein [Shinella yambaruensis]MCU7982070.1 hypothetical protein [Shinella yambaruensis]GLR51244.1 hypothetical protein GCM10007923_24520 [Shinella yambaruensis]
MTRALGIVRAAKLLMQSQCPVCGADRTETIGGARSPIAICVYRCTAEFEVDGNGEIIPMNVCPSASYGAAARLNREARADALRQAGGA